VEAESAAELSSAATRLATADMGKPAAAALGTQQRVATQLHSREPKGVGLSLGVEQRCGLGCASRLLGRRLLGTVWTLHAHGWASSMVAKPVRFAGTWEPRVVLVCELRAYAGRLRTSESGLHLRSE
jgi:hypothetical protein